MATFKKKFGGKKVKITVWEEGDNAHVRIEYPPGTTAEEKAKIAGEVAENITKPKKN